MFTQRKTYRKKRIKVDRNEREREEKERTVWVFSFQDKLSIGAKVLTNSGKARQKNRQKDGQAETYEQKSTIWSTTNVWYKKTTYKFRSYKLYKIWFFIPIIDGVNDKQVHWRAS